MAHGSQCPGFHSCHYDYEIIDLDESLTEPWKVDEIISDIRHQYAQVSAQYFQSPLCQPFRRVCGRDGDTFPSPCKRVYSTDGNTLPPTGCSAVDTSCRRRTLRSSSHLSATTASVPLPISQGSTTAIKEPKAKRSKAQKPTRESATMDNPVVKAVLDMGISETKIWEAILARRAEKGDEFTSSEALVDAIFSSEVRSDTHNPNAGEDFSCIQEAFGVDAIPTSEVKSTARKTNTDSVRPVDDNSLKLKEENRLLKEQKQCKICMDGDVCVVFMPCGHLVCCDSCAPSVKTCPICRARIKKSVRAYLS